MIYLLTGLDKILDRAFKIGGALAAGAHIYNANRNRDDDKDKNKKVKVYIN